MKVGSFIPEQSASTLYAMAGDDCSLHHDLSSLTPKQQVDHQENQVLTCALQVALVGLGKKNDHVALGAPFTDPSWREMLGHYSEMFVTMGLDSVQNLRPNLSAAPLMFPRCQQSNAQE
jgi:hypothetical protein